MYEIYLNPIWKPTETVFERLPGDAVGGMKQPSQVPVGFWPFFPKLCWHEHAGTMKESMVHGSEPLVS